MAVEFPSDLILDVARAADPAATRNLEARLNAGETTGGIPASAVRLSRTAQAPDAGKAAKDFETLLVSNMVEDMMGDSEQSYFGGGFAGSVWKSMMAEQIAARVVETADFGVASKVRATSSSMATTSSRCAASTTRNRHLTKPGLSTPSAAGRRRSAASSYAT